MDNALRPIVILGVGGFAQEVAWLIDDINAAQPRWNLLGFVDTVACGKSEHYGLPVLGGYDAVSKQFGQVSYVCGMGAPAIRVKESAAADSCGWQASTLVHPSAIQAKFVTIDKGTTVGPGCVVGPNVRIGRHCVINMQATIGHDATVGDFSVISPGAHIAGHVVLENAVFIGANSSVYPGKRVGANATLAANSFLHTDLAAGVSAIGVPAKVFHRSVARD